MRLTRFSDSALVELSKENKPFYIYCLIDSVKDEVFYVGKGCGNRVFQHILFAENKIKREELAEQESDITDLKTERIKQLISQGKEPEIFIVKYGLTEKEAYAGESALINFLTCLQGKLLTNKVSGHGSTGMYAKDLEDRYGYSPISVNDLSQQITPDNLILAVKIQNAFTLDKDESDKCGGYKENNLKCRTLGIWRLGKRTIFDRNGRLKIKYIIGINTGANNAVVSAYEINEWKQVFMPSSKTDKKHCRYNFCSESKSEDTLKQLGLYKKCIPDLSFGSGSAIAYIKKPE